MQEQGQIPTYPSTPSENLQIYENPKTRTNLHRQFHSVIQLNQQDPSSKTLPSFHL